MKKLFNSTIILILLLVSAACNDDVFVDRPDDIGDDTVITIDGDGGSDEIRYPVKKLTGITVHHYGNCVFEFIDKDGRPVDKTDSHSYEVTREGQLHITGDLIDIWLDFGHAGLLGVYVDCNALYYDFKVGITFDYAEASRYVTVVATPGSRCILDNISYDFSRTVKGKNNRQVRLPAVHNNSDNDLPFTFDLSHYLPDCVRFRFADGCGELIDKANPMPVAVPSVNAAGTAGLFGKGALFIDGIQQESDSDLDAEIKMMAPARSILTITVDVGYTILEVPFTATVSNIKTGRLIVFDGKVQVALPGDYNVNIKEEKL